MSDFAVSPIAIDVITLFPEMFQALVAQGVVIRPMASYGLPQWIRVSVGLPEENHRFLDTLAQVLA